MGHCTSAPTGETNTEGPTVDPTKEYGHIQRLLKDANAYTEEIIAKMSDQQSLDTLHRFNKDKPIGPEKNVLKKDECTEFCLEVYFFLQQSDRIVRDGGDGDSEKTKIAKGWNYFYREGDTEQINKEDLKIGFETMFTAAKKAQNANDGTWVSYHELKK